MAPTVYPNKKYTFAGAAAQVGIKEDISDAIDAIDARDTPLLSILGWGAEAGAAGGANTLRFPAIQPKHQWLNDELIPSTTTLSATPSAWTTGDTAADVTFALASGTGEYFDKDDIIMIGDCLLIITSARADMAADIVTATPVKTNLGGTAIASGDTVYNLGKAALEGVNWASQYDFGYTALAAAYNFTQIFTDIVDVTGTMDATEMYGVDSTFNRELDKKFKEIIIRLERAAHYGFRNRDAADGSTLTLPTAATDEKHGRRMGGLFDFIRSDSTANRKDGASATLTEKTLNDCLQDIYTDGGNPDTILVGPWRKRVLSTFITPNVRVDRTERVAGVIVGQYESEFGILDIVLDRYVRPSDVIILQKEFLGIGPLAGGGNSRAFAVENLPKTTDATVASILGEYTMEVRNANRAHGWIYDLATS